MNKICTSIEQSKKLIKLGININTANMHYNNLSITHGSDCVNDFNAELMDYNSAVKLLTKYIHNPLFEIIPAWSLSALLRLMSTFTLNGFGNGQFNCRDERANSYALVDTCPLDAAFEMVCWLKENGKI